MKEIYEALAFDDVLLQPAYSEVLPHKTDVQTQLSTNITLNIPLLSAAMDTVTEANLAIAMAEQGGIGVIHKNMSIDEQVEQIRKVKSHVISTTQACKDGCGRLRVAAAIGTSAIDIERAKKLAASGVDALVIDTAHGDSKYVIDQIHNLKKLNISSDIIAGNIATAAAVHDLINAGVNGIKVGIGPGSICTTRIIAGVGVPQFSALLETCEEAQKYKIPIIADGGIRFSGDIAKAIAAGASSIMIGSLLAGTDEAPGEEFLYHGRSYKSYRGMGSQGAMIQGFNDRYGENRERKFIPEGVEGRVPSKGPVIAVVEQLIGGVKAAMGYTGNSNIPSMQKNCVFRRITHAGLRESHVHDITITRESPNYHSERF